MQRIDLIEPRAGLVYNRLRLRIGGGPVLWAAGSASRVLIKALLVALSAVPVATIAVAVPAKGVGVGGIAVAVAGGAVGIAVVSAGAGALVVGVAELPPHAVSTSATASAKMMPIVGDLLIRGFTHTSFVSRCGLFVAA